MSARGEECMASCKWLKWALLALAVFALSSCVPPGPTEAEQRMFQVRLLPVDFPIGWKDQNDVVEDIEGALAARTWAFVSRASTPSLHIGAAHMTIVFPSTEVAANAYPNLAAKWFPNAKWIAPQQLSYVGSSADRFKLACLPSEINGITASSCRAIGQYGDLMSIFIANVYEDRWFTWTDLEHVLQVIDERMAAQMR